MTDVPTAGSAPSRAAIGRDRQADGYDILILDAANRQSLLAVQSLGRAGLRVAVGECFAECDPAQPVLTFRSRYSAHNVVLPSYAASAADFAAAVVEFARKHPTRVVLPTSDGAIAALTPVRDQLAAIGCVLALSSDSVLEIANDKDRTLAIARDLGIDHPRTRLIDTSDDAAATASELEYPVVLKPKSSWAPQSTVRLQAVEAVSEAEAAAVIRTVLDAGTSVLAQQWAGGRREGITMCVVGGDVLASCAHLQLRTSPALGGVSVLRKSIPLPQDSFDAALRLVKAIGLEGLCEVEFRRDASDRPLLMEINARLAGSLENAIRSGIDFPLLLWQWATGQPVNRVSDYKKGVRTRWLRGDMRWLRDNYRRVGRPDSVSRTRALAMFAAEFVRTRRYDCLDWRDFGPILAELRITAVSVRNSRKNRLAPQIQSH